MNRTLPESHRSWELNTEGSRSPPEDPVLRSARREAIVVAIVWLAAMIYTVGYSYTHGYGRVWESVEFIWGFPDWVFWGIVVPWLVCFAVSFWFSMLFMRDEDLGEELDREADDLQGLSADPAQGDRGEK